MIKRLREKFYQMALRAGATPDMADNVATNRMRRASALKAKAKAKAKLEDDEDESAKRKPKPKNKK
jgi:hypothetical protein